MSTHNRLVIELSIQICPSGRFSYVAEIHFEASSVTVKRRSASNHFPKNRSLLNSGMDWYLGQPPNEGI